MDEQRKQFLEMESTPGKDAVVMVEMASKVQIITPTSQIKQRQGLRGLTPSSKGLLVWINAIKQRHTLQWNTLWKEESMDVANFTVVFFQGIAMVIPDFRNHHPGQSAVISTEAGLPTSKKITTH